MSGRRNQFLSAISVNILTLGVGGSMVWTSPYLSVLKSSESPLSQPITNAEASTLGGLMPIGALIGAFVSGKIAEKFGRCRALYLNALPQITWWLIVIFTSNLYVLFIGRFLSGISIGSAYTLVPLYTAEICQDKIRGSLNAVFIFAMNFGMLLIYIAGEFLNFYTTHKLFLLISISFLIIFMFFPDTPIYLFKCGKTSQAEKSLKFFRGYQKSDDVNEKLSDEIMMLKKKVESFTTTTNSSMSPVALKAVIFGVILIFLHQISGLLAFVGYAADIFRESGSSLSPNKSAIIVGILLITGSFISIILMDKFSRKKLYTITTIGSIFGLLMMGFYGLFKEHVDMENWKSVPIICLSIVILSSTAGRLPLTYIIATEIQPQSNRSMGIAICSASNWLTAFLVLQLYSTSIEVLKFHNCMYIFSVFLIVSLTFVHFFVPETKSKSFEQIEDELKSGIQLKKVQPLIN